MSNHDAETKSTNPGASRHGNFINYYQFHSVEERVRQLPLEICQSAKNNDGKFVALDVGCNAGVRIVLFVLKKFNLIFFFFFLNFKNYLQNLTLELYEFLKKNLPNREIVILGIDIDPILIVRARELIADRDPLLPITFENLDFLSNDREKIVTAFLEKHQVVSFYYFFLIYSLKKKKKIHKFFLPTFFIHPCSRILT